MMIQWVFKNFNSQRHGVRKSMRPMNIRRLSLWSVRTLRQISISCFIPMLAAPPLSLSHSAMDEVTGTQSGNTQVKYFSTDDLSADLPAAARPHWSDMDNYEQNRTVSLAGTSSFSGQLNGRSFVISGKGTDDNGDQYIDVSTSGLSVL